MDIIEVARFELLGKYPEWCYAINILNKFTDAYSLPNRIRHRFGEYLASNMREIYGAISIRRIMTKKREITTNIYDSSQYGNALVIAQEFVKLNRLEFDNNMWKVACKLEHRGLCEGCRQGKLELGISNNNNIVKCDVAIELAHDWMNRNRMYMKMFDRDSSSFIDDITSFYRRYETLNENIDIERICNILGRCGKCRGYAHDGKSCSSIVAESVYRCHYILPPVLTNIIVSYC